MWTAFHKWLSVVAIVGAFLVLCSSCSKLDPHVNPDNSLEYVVTELNRFVEGLHLLAEAKQEGCWVDYFDLKINDDGSSTYQIIMDDGRELLLINEIISSKVSVPVISIGEVDGELYWSLDGQWLCEDDGTKVRVLDHERIPRFILKEGAIVFALGDASGFRSIVSRDKNGEFLLVSFDPVSSCFSVKLCSEYVFSFLLKDKYALLKRGVPNQAFYKDVFLDAGVGLNSQKPLSAMRRLGLSYENMDFSRSAEDEDELRLQHNLIVGSDEDANGRLLYPDGQPRFRLLYVIGGKASVHGRLLGENGLERMRRFVNNGGSYAGSCAGAFFASNGHDYPYYLDLWPGAMETSGVSKSEIDMTIPKNSPLLHYFYFGNDYRVSKVYHSGGGFPSYLPVGTRVLAHFACPEIPSIDEQPSIWSYENDEMSGRIVVTGSHPEYASSGEILDLTCAMIMYALDGVGEVGVKDYLVNGQPRLMYSESSADQPLFTRIGDLQVHHFSVYIPHDSKDIVFNLECPSNTILKLLLCKDSYAFDSTADYCSISVKGKTTLSFPSLSEGIWYIGVQCMTTVSTLFTKYGQEYTGRTDVLNGVPYKITASWK